MTYVRRLKMVSGLLAVFAVLTTSHVWGQPARKTHDQQDVGVATGKEPAADNLSDELAAHKFSSGRPISYRTTDDQTLFALQIKPALPPASERATDYLLLIDTSASQVRGPLTAAIQIAEGLLSLAK